MMVYKIDTYGYYVEDVILSSDDLVPSNCVTLQPPQGLYKPKWTGIKWIEGKAEDEFLEDEFLTSLQPSKSEVQKAKRELEIVNLLIELEVIR